MSHRVRKKKKCGGGFLKISYMNDETPVSDESITVHDSHQSQNTPSPYLHSASWDWQALSPTSFLFLSLSNYWTLGRWTKAVHKDYTAKKKKKKKKKKLFTIKTNKNQYIKTIFLARQKAYKNIHKKSI